MTYISLLGFYRIVTYLGLMVPFSSLYLLAKWQDSVMQGDRF